MYPSELILLILPLKLNPLSFLPDEKLIVFFSVLNEPNVELSLAKGSVVCSSVFMLMEAPNAAAPLLELPTPLCICMLSTDDAKSGKSTK